MNIIEAVKALKKGKKITHNGFIKGYCLRIDKTKPIRYGNVLCIHWPDKFTNAEDSNYRFDLEDINADWRIFEKPKSL